jgi:hypothetical protein
MSADGFEAIHPNRAAVFNHHGGRDRILPPVTPEITRRSGHCMVKAEDAPDVVITAEAG